MFASLDFEFFKKYSIVSGGTPFTFLLWELWLCVCVRACARACMRVCMCVCVCANGIDPSCGLR